MGVDGGIPSSSRQILTLPVGNMPAISLDVSFGQSKINDKYFVAGFVESNAEVIRFDIPMEEVAIVDILNSWDHLVDEHEGRFEGEPSEGVLEQTLERGAHEVHDEDVVIAWNRWSGT